MSDGSSDRFEVESSQSVKQSDFHFQVHSVGTSIRCSREYLHTYVGTYS